MSASAAAYTKTPRASSPLESYLPAVAVSLLFPVCIYFWDKCFTGKKSKNAAVSFIELFADDTAGRPLQVDISTGHRRSRRENRLILRKAAIYEKSPCTTFSNAIADNKIVVFVRGQGCAESVCYAGVGVRQKYGGNQRYRLSGLSWSPPNPPR